MNQIYIILSTNENLQNTGIDSTVQYVRVITNYDCHSRIRCKDKQKKKKKKQMRWIHEEKFGEMESKSKCCVQDITV